MIELPIDTPRIRLRPLSGDDLAAVHSILGDPATTAEVSWGQPDQASTAGWIERRVAQQRDHGYSMWAAELRETSEIVGLAGFFPHSDHQMELGYVLRADHWGQGLASEATAAALDAADKIGIPIVVTIRPTNHRSLAVARRIGLTQDDAITDDRGTLLVFRRPTTKHQ